MTRWDLVRAVVRTDLRRKIRRLRGDDTQLAATAIAAVFLLPVGLLGVVGAFLAGRAVTGGEVSAPVTIAREAFAYAWVAGAIVAAWRTYVTALPPDNRDGLLTTISHRTLALGLLATELSLWFLITAVGGGIATVAFAVGSGSPAAIPAGMIALIVLVGTTVSVGFAGALGVRTLSVRYGLVGRLRTPLVVVAALGYGWAVMTSSVGAVLAPLVAVVEPTPVGWLGDLALLFTHAGANPLRAGGVLATVVFVAVAAVPVIDRLAATAWYADGSGAGDAGATSSDEVNADPDVNTSPGQGAPPASGGWLSRVCPSPVVGVIRADWARARRAPITLSYALYPLVVLVSPVSSSVREGAVAGSLPLWLALCGAWIAGSLFALNAIGGQGTTLPVVLLGDSPGRALVRGHVLAGLLLAGPVAVLATLVTALLGPQALTSALTLGALATVLCLVAGPIASGIGVALPKFEAVSVSRGSEAILPSMLAFTAYSLILLAVALPGLLAHSAILGHAIVDWTGLGRVSVALIGTALTALIGSAVGITSGRYAVRRIDGYHLD